MRVKIAKYSRGFPEPRTPQVYLEQTKKQPPEVFYNKRGS